METKNPGMKKTGLYHHNLEEKQNNSVTVLKWPTLLNIQYKMVAAALSELSCPEPIFKFGAKL